MGKTIWKNYARCKECGVVAGCYCRDENDNPMTVPCKGRALNAALATVKAPRGASPYVIRDQMAQLRSDLADRTEQVKALSAKLEAAEKKLADIHALSK